jgi:hypothetical protein
MQALERDSVLYQRVIELEQALSERTRALESLLLDDRVLRATVARLDADFVKLQTDLVQEKERSGDLEGSCRALQDELALTESNLRSAVDKNRVLVRVHDVRQKRIEELTGALERRGSSAHEIRQLRAAIHANEAELDSARSAQQVLVKVVRKREEELDQVWRRGPPRVCRRGFRSICGIANGGSYKDSWTGSNGRDEEPRRNLLRSEAGQMLWRSQLRATTPRMPGSRPPCRRQ